jgi:hypothetical protein
MPASGYAQFVIRFRGADFDTWKAAFDAHQLARVRHGAVGHWIARSIRDSNEFIAVVEFTSPGGATGYAIDDDRLNLERGVMIDGGPHHRTWEEGIYETVDTETYRQ